jgi:lectin, mannose-binding 2
MDLQGNGEYIDCAIVDNPSLPPEWLKKAHVGITATTGALADNHDIISLQSFSDFDVLESFDLEAANSKYFEPGPAYDRQGRFRKFVPSSISSVCLCLTLSLSLPLVVIRIEQAIDDLMKKNQVREHHIEHAFASIEDHLKTVIAKIEKRGGDSDVRIEDLEAVASPLSLHLSLFLF